MPHGFAQQRYVGFGWVIQDRIMRVDSYPVENTKLAAIGEPLAQSGGPTVRALMAIARCGSEGVTLGAIGPDTPGREISAELESLGLTVGGLVVDESVATRQAQVWLAEAGDERGTRTIVYSTVGPEARPGDLDFDELLEGASALVLDGRHPATAVEAAKSARREGVLVALDLGSPKDSHEELVALADIVIGPRGSWQALGVGKIAGDGGVPVSLQTKLCIATAGSQAVYAWWKGERAYFEPPRVKVIDSNGAGDVFCGLVVWSITHGLSPQAAIEFASMGAGIKCETLGNDGVPWLSEILARWRTVGSLESQRWTVGPTEK